MSINRRPIAKGHELDVHRIHSLTWHPADDWLCWRPDDPRGARTSAAALADGPRLDALLAAVAEFDAVIAQEVPGTAGAALWVPDPATREPCATAALRLTSPDAVGRWSIDRTLEFARSQVTVPRGSQVLDVVAVPTSTPVGEAVLQIVDSRRRRSRRVTREWAWYILPPGTDETLLLQVQSDLVSLFAQIGDLAAEVADSITVELGPA